MHEAINTYKDMFCGQQLIHMLYHSRNNITLLVNMPIYEGKFMTDKDAAIDDLDKHILQQMSRGISSYEDLSRECNVTRSTIYRRVALLEKRGLIRRTTRTVVDYEKLDIVT